MAPSTASSGYAVAPAVSAGARVRLLLALSRAAHALLDVATPALGAILCLGGALPPLSVSLLGLLTAGAAYLSVYALNDLVDCAADREKMRWAGGGVEGDYLDAVGVRHPLAQGLLSVRAAALWAGGWGLVAIVGAWRLNPVCAGIFLIGCALEALYCRLLTVSWLRVLVSGVVKTLGGVAAAFAVDPQPPPGFLALFFLWVFCWEIGGQNVPADWVDLDGDAAFGARTIPVRFGAAGAAWLALTALALATAGGALLLGGTAGTSSAPVVWTAAGAAAGLWFLLLPGARLLRQRSPAQAAALFNRASSYPLAMLALVLLGRLL
ncbi:MAG TPA: UbiA family prenyltransferase [bacterium]